MEDPFTTLGVARRFSLDAQELAQRHRDLSRALHPDRFVGGTPHERRIAIERASAVNDAFRLLRDPLARATALLALHGRTIADNERAPTSLLMVIMDLREALDDARHTPDAVRALRDRVSAMELEHTRTVADALDAAAPSPDALDAAKQAAIAWKYLRRFLEEADALES